MKAFPNLLALSALVIIRSLIPPALAADPTYTGLLSATRDVGCTPNGPPAKNAPAIPWDQIGAKAGADYQGDELRMTPTVGGARLHCVFQRLDGEATREGLWLSSTVTNQANDRFRVRAVAVGRCGSNVERGAWERERVRPALQGQGSDVSGLSGSGTVSVDGETARYSRLGLVEEYSVSMDGVRQDFVVTTKPAGAGELQVLLDVAGAKVERMAGGSRLVLPQSGRKIAYRRLRATDARGRELPARLEVGSPRRADRGDEASKENSNGALGGRALPTTLSVVVNDAGAAYPVRVDPTFSDENWGSLGGVAGANGTVWAVVVDGSGHLYIGGAFTVVGNTTANYIAEWNGSSWSALGSGMNKPVLALAVSGGTLFAGGQFTSAGGSAANYVAQWNGSSWSALGSGTGNPVQALALLGSTLYAAEGASAGYYVLQWNGSSWSAPDLSCWFNGPVHALVVSGSTLYAGGEFGDTINHASYVAQWNGSSWLAVGSGVGGSVYALAASGGTLYAGGQFMSAGGSPAYRIAQWNGSTWSGVGGGMDNTVYALAVSGGTLYAGGCFQLALNGSEWLQVNGIAQWNGSSWSALGSGINGSSNCVNVVAVSGGMLYAGGSFATAGDNAASNLAQWNGSNWSALGTGWGMNGSVRSLAVSGGTLYAGGYFTTAGGSTVNYIAKWNGSSWSALGSGMNGVVEVLTVSGDGTLYAGGYFTTAGGSTVNHIAKWNGSNWSALGSGMGGTSPFVYALALSGNTLYAGGSFTTAGGIPANCIAQWNGSSWSALGLGIGGNSPYVFALAVSGSTLYVGGSFTTAGGIPASDIAQWNGSSWSALGSGMNNGVNALAVSGSGTLYAGGAFTTAGDSYVDYVAQWNGSTWSTVGGGIYDAVDALAVSGSRLYAGGSFVSAGYAGAAYIAQWNGNSWSALGSGLNDRVLTLAVSGNTLYAGGDFTTAGGKVSYHAAGVRISPPTVLTQPQSTSALVGSNAVFTVSAGGSLPLTYVWNSVIGGVTNAVGAGVTIGSANTLTLTNVQASQAGTYSVTISNACGWTNSTQATLAVSCTIGASSWPPGRGSTAGGGTVVCGSNVTMCATANPCYSFVNWTEGANVVSTTSCYTFTAATNRALVANFAPLGPYSISASASPPLGGTTSGSGTVACGSNVTVCATGTPCTSFVNWTEGTNVVSTTSCYTFTAVSNRTLVANFAPGTPLTFTANTYNVGSQPFSVVAADVNGDGKPDLICANYGDNTLTVLTNNGSGAFGSNATLSVGGHPYFVVAADVNGDGKPDLISANDGANTLTVLINNGSGSFPTSATLNVGTGPVWVAAADVNGDGKPDLISANYQAGTLTVLTNNGSGGFATSATLNLGSFSYPDCVIPADVNGDGRLDLICSDYDRQVTVLTNSASGAFGSNATIRVGAQPLCIAAADFNLDGKLELVTANYGDTTLTVLTNNRSGGFGSNTVLHVGPSPAYVVAVDLNGDGLPDLVSANYGTNTLTVLTNNGSGGFGTSATLSVGQQPNCAIAADVNGDGKLDLISANSGGDTLTVLINTTASPAPPLITNPPASQAVGMGDTATFTVVVGGGQPMGRTWYSIISGVTNAVGSGVTAGPTNTLTLANAEANQAGSYFVTIANSCGSLNSALATLAVTNRPLPSTISASSWLPGAGFQFAFTNTHGASFSVWATTNVALHLSNWMPLTGLSEVAPGQFRFTDPQATNLPRRFYRVRSP